MATNSLSFKLTLAFLFMGLMGALMVAFFVGLRTQREFDRFVSARDRFSYMNMLTEHYKANGTWKGVEAILSRNRIRASERWGAHPPLAVTLVDARGTIVFGTNPNNVGHPVAMRDRKRGVPIRVNNRVVGWLLIDPPGVRPPVPGSPEAAFLARMTRAITYSALGAAAIALLLGGLLARTLTRPIRELIAATRAVARGNLGQQVKVRTQDELGELAASFNQMSTDLAQASALRRQMTADIAHELRTPLSLILGYTEALSDGKLPATLETFEILHDGAQRLSHVVDDLRLLSLADAGELPLTRRLVDPQDLLRRTASAYKAQAQEHGISLRVETQPDLAPIKVDPDRMAQVLGNLVSNALRFTPSGGEIVLLAHSEPTMTRLSVQDTGAGIAPEDLPHVFDRFYRGDKSRYRGEGESGLGLAIAKSLVEMHGGTITAESTPGQGTTFTIAIPTVRATPTIRG